MKFKKLIIFSFVFLFIKDSYCIGLKTDVSSEVSSVYLGSEWAWPGFFAETVEVQRLLPILLYYKALVLQNIAKEIVKRKDFVKIFELLDESPFKMILRRQYYLNTKGIPIDKTSITFSVQELLDAGILDENIENAKNNGKLDLSNLKISSLYGLNNVADKVNRLIFTLNLSNNEIEIVNSNVFRFYFSRLKNLDLSYNKIFFLQLGCFDNLENLEFLDLGHNKLGYFPNVFALLINLKRLDISDNKIEKIDIWKLKGLQNLEMLNFADNKIKNISEKDLNKALPKLKEFKY